MNSSTTTTQPPTPQPQMRTKAIMLGVLLVLAGGLTALILVLQKEDSAADNPTTYAECLTGGGVVMETYPEQCSIDGKTFVNDQQVVDPSIGEPEDSFEDGLCTAGICDESVESAPSEDDSSQL